MAGTAVLVVAFATSCAAHGAARTSVGVATPYVSNAPGQPVTGRLGGSTWHGLPGTVVTLHAVNCLPRGSKPDEIIWQDSAHAKGGQPIPGVVRTGNYLDATFVIPSNAPPGPSFFDTYCGAKSIEAMSTFNVDAH